ncbi:cupin domain-containing protein, partial [Novosphingobium sp. 9U]|uniref:cupin domain-containing protein n=1 Tax=Novosphingobium sp. 9U TaxID=2653158 RepID=UPI0013568856
MDVLDGILSSLKLNGGVVFDARCTGDWCVVSQFKPEQCAPFFAIPDEIISYHFVRKGRVFAQLPCQAAAEVSEGSLILFPRNGAHLLFTAPGLEPTDMAEYVGPGSNGAVNSIVMDLGEEPTQLYCGWLGVPTGAHPLLAALPSMLLVSCDSFAVDWIASSLSIAAREWRNSPSTVAKISELLFAQAVKRYAQDAPDGSWLAALRDPIMAKALAAIHMHYGQDLSLDALAKEAG